MKWIKDIRKKVRAKIGGYLHRRRFGMTEVEYAHVLDCLETAGDGGRVKAIKAVRHYLCLGLKDSRDIVGVIEDTL